MYQELTINLLMKDGSSESYSLPQSAVIKSAIDGYLTGSRQKGVQFTQNDKPKVLLFHCICGYEVVSSTLQSGEPDCGTICG